MEYTRFDRRDLKSQHRYKVSRGTDQPPPAPQPPTFFGKGKNTKNLRYLESAQKIPKPSQITKNESVIANMSLLFPIYDVVLKFDFGG